MAKPAQKGTFTGRHMAAILVVGFGIVAAVNFTMAGFAVSGFHGTVVDNSYVASQEFNGWLEQAEQSRALGWEAAVTRDVDGFVVLSTTGVPTGAQITAQLRRPLGTREYASLIFAPVGNGQYRSADPVNDGRWTMRLFIDASGRRWAHETELP